ncbi:hypothetical protein RFI_24818, partial [Reticulomyxa filosa]
NQKVLQSEKRETKTGKSSSLELPSILHGICTLLGIIPLSFVQTKEPKEKKPQASTPARIVTNENKSKPLIESVDKDDLDSPRNNEVSNTHISFSQYSYQHDFNRVGNHLMRYSGMSELLWWYQDLLTYSNVLLQAYFDLCNWKTVWVTKYVVCALLAVDLYLCIYRTCYALVLCYGLVILCYYSKVSQFLLWLVKGFLSWSTWYFSHDKLSSKLLSGSTEANTTTDKDHNDNNNDDNDNNPNESQSSATPKTNDQNKAQTIWRWQQKIVDTVKPSLTILHLLLKLGRLVLEQIANVLFAIIAVPGWQFITARWKTKSSQSTPKLKPASRSYKNDSVPYRLNKSKTYQSLAAEPAAPIPSKDEFGFLCVAPLLCFSFFAKICVITISDGNREERAPPF